MFLPILFAFAVIAVLGGLLGFGLAVASKALAVEKDERIEHVENILPGVNCGACGYAGCSSYAEAVVKEDEELTLCSPGGPEVVSELGKYLGKEVDTSGEKLVAQVHCRGNREKAKEMFNFKGHKDCGGMSIFFGGDKVCKFGCLGQGSCIKVCPVDAIRYDEENCVWVDKDKCISCEKCINVCPTNVIEMIPYSANLIVACNSKDKGALVRKYCSVGCIGCKICEKKSPEGGFIVEDFLATLDYSQDGDRSEAKEKCPAKCIIEVKN